MSPKAKEALKNMICPILPVWGKLRYFIAASVLARLVTPFAAAQLPSAQKVLEEKNLDPRAAEELAPGEKIHVGQDSVAAKMTFLGLNTPVFPIGAVMYMLGYQGRNAFTLPTSMPNNFSGRCYIALPDKQKHWSAKEYTSFVTDIPERDIKNMPVSIQEIHTATALHEIAHCAQKNVPPSEWEMDADFRSLPVAARVLKNPEIVRYRFNTRAAYFPGEEHDTALYLDARLNGRPAPSTDKIQGANLQAEEFVIKGKTDLSQLSDLAQRRVTLYREARRYFTEAPKGL